MVEFDHFRKEAGLPTFTLSVSNWIEKTGAIGLVSKVGRYGGTYAHKDIAFEFCGAISPVFKLYLIKEYQRLKEQESSPRLEDWKVKRILSKVNYEIHTDAVRVFIVPQLMEESQIKFAYTSEADMLNLALFHYTAKQWRDENPVLAAKGLNPRDVASAGIIQPLDRQILLSSRERQNQRLFSLSCPLFGPSGSFPGRERQNRVHFSLSCPYFAQSEGFCIRPMYNFTLGVGHFVFPDMVIDLILPATSSGWSIRNCPWFIPGNTST